mmetsp:Transcript_15455/g.34862  ORF Transcript_15455/g.34862 Transcript_15455/m.34862 type:complete len:352 (+) Transcript_15455:64-1119(+)
MELFLRAVCPGVLRELAPICCTDTSEELKVPESAIMAYPVAGKAEQDNPSALSALNRGTLATTMIADGRSACEMASASVGSERRASGRAATDKRQASAEVAADGSQACPASQAVAVGEESDAAAPGDASGGSPACADADAPPRAKEPLPKRTPPPLLRLPTPSRAAPRRSVEDPVAFPAAKASKRRPRASGRSCSALRAAQRWIARSHPHRCASASSCGQPWRARGSTYTSGAVASASSSTPLASGTTPETRRTRRSALETARLQQSVMLPESNEVACRVVKPSCATDRSPSVAPCLSCEGEGIGPVALASRTVPPERARPLVRRGRLPLCSCRLRPCEAWNAPWVFWGDT